MTCERAKAEADQAWADWKVALDKLTSLVNLGGVTYVDEEGAKAIENASEEFATADRRFLTAVRVHLITSDSHKADS